jgi:hypothetical protein
MVGPWELLGKGQMQTAVLNSLSIVLNALPLVRAVRSGSKIDKVGYGPFFGLNMKPHSMVPKMAPAITAQISAREK